MNIGEAARKSGLSAKTIRFYEDIALVPTAARDQNGYRRYDERAVRLLQFVNRARSLGFSVEQCRELLTLYSDQARASADVKAIALVRIDDIDQKMRELEAMRATLVDLADRCHGDGRPDCPILAELAT